MTTIVILEVVFKTSFVLAAAWGASRLMRRSTAAARHLAWATALAAAVVVLAITTAGPRFGLPVLPPEASTPGLSVRAMTPAPEATLPFVVHQAPLAVEATAAPMSKTLLSPGSDRTVGPSWMSLFAVLWAVGTLLLLVRLSTGLTLVGRLARRSVAIADSASRRTLAGAMQKLRITRPVGLLESDAISVPMMGGIRNPSNLSAAGMADMVAGAAPSGAAP